MQTRIGFVGTGFIADRHLAVLLGFEDALVVAAADPQEDRARSFAERCGATAYAIRGDARARAARRALRLRPAVRARRSRAAAIEHGLPFFVEKPLAADLATAERIAAAVAARGLVTAVGYHWRYLDIVERAQELLARAPPRLALGYWLDSTPPPPWWARQRCRAARWSSRRRTSSTWRGYLVGEVDPSTPGGRLETRRVPGADIDDVSRRDAAASRGRHRHDSPRPASCAGRTASACTCSARAWPSSCPSSS